MTDRRGEILDSQVNNGTSGGTVTALNRYGRFDCRIIKEAMDEYMKECCLALLEYMAKNDVKCTWYEHEVKGIVYTFHYKGESISKEQLFENFL